MTSENPEPAGGHVTVRKADLDVLVACCTSYLPSGVSPEAGEALGRLLGAWEAAGGDGPRCPDCGVPLSMHHDPGCGEPCGACEASKARSTVTVTAPDGAEITYAASEIQPAPDGYLRLYAGGKTILAVAPGGWASAEEDGHRAPGAPDHAARTAGLEIVLREVSAIASGRDTGGIDRLTAIRGLADRALAAGK